MISEKEKILQERKNSTIDESTTTSAPSIIKNSDLSMDSKTKYS
jgi:hypothetical protein